ncbi:MAG: HPF/RaiA family ribosome-associated protein [Gemmatimonadota bacterium]|nr:HPF/RaiA family ribosome-associated protein [Gemmatimonadota bacterium]MDH4350957.1 HPF/RaiA family ribosome-associated protein [Gemmatimonadota bacterium]MDH5198881.1 HPF/RaiA family ribosome-associated protein [Gemmatimonadota bacterium]
MQTTVTARHCEIPDEVRTRAEEVAEKLAGMAHRPQRMEIVFDDDHQRRVVELKMWLPPGQTLVATAEATDFRTALDRAAEKLRSQLEKSGRRPPRRQPAA